MGSIGCSGSIILEHGADPGGGVKIGAPLDVVVAKYCVGLAVLFEN